MSKVNDGGPAFPYVETILADTKGDGALYAVGSKEHAGLSLRDYFAGQALAGDLASWTRDCDGQFKPEDVSHRAYLYADAMLAARAAR